MQSGQGTLRGRLGPLYAVRVIHPFPTLANVIAVVLLAFVAARGAPAVVDLVRLAATILCIQSAIGAANDAFDVELDRLSKPYKPIVAGALSRRAAAVVAVVAASVACVLAAGFGFVPWLLAMGGLACGLAYDAGLKRTPLGVIPYMLALPLLPLWVWAALGRLSGGLFWLYPFGILIGVALYLGNTAPDIAADAAAGVAGTAHRLGLRWTLLVAWGCLGLTLLLGPALAPSAGYDLARVLVAALVAALFLAAAVLVSLGRRDEAALRVAWGLLIACSLSFALGWLAAAP